MCGNDVRRESNTIESQVRPRLAKWVDALSIAAQNRSLASQLGISPTWPNGGGWMCGTRAYRRGKGEGGWGGRSWDWVGWRVSWHPLLARPPTHIVCTQVLTRDELHPFDEVRCTFEGCACPPGAIRSGDTCEVRSVQVSNN